MAAPTEDVASPAGAARPPGEPEASGDPPAAEPEGELEPVDPFAAPADGPPLDPESLAPIGPPPIETGMTPEEEEALARIASRIDLGDERTAVDAARTFAMSGVGRAHAAAWFVVAILEQQAHPNAAVSAFEEARRIDGPLAPLATWLLTDHQLDHGEPLRAIEIASDYLARWPNGRHVTDCHGALGLAWAMLGNAEEARASAARWQSRSRRDSLHEQIDLELALHAMRTDPLLAVEPLRRLATRFVSPEVGETAAHALESLVSSGVIPTAFSEDLGAMQTRAVSFRDAGLVDEAWDAFVAVRERGATDPAAAAWAESNIASFGFATRQWDELEIWYRERWARSPSTELAWDAWRAASRGGRYEAARGWLAAAMARSPHANRFVAAPEMVGRTLLIGGEPAEAVAWFDRTARLSGSNGRRNAFLSAFSRWRAGDVDGAVAGFSALISPAGPYDVEARYWRARALDSRPAAASVADPGDPPPPDLAAAAAPEATPVPPQLGPETAAADRAWILEHAGDSWYALLLKSQATTPLRSQRDGLWPASYPPHWWTVIPVDPMLERAPDATRRLLSLHDPLIWSPEQGTRRLPEEPPEPGYPVGPYHDPERARAAFLRFADRWGDRWPDLHAVSDLSRAGLHELAGPLFSALYGEIRSAAYRGERTARAASSELDPAERLPLFLFTRDHHHTARDTVGLVSAVTTPDDRLATARLTMPVAYPRAVWASARASGLDPFLALSIMRAESTYDANAVSRANARGPMQILPRTGFLLAALDDNRRFTTRSLHDPLVAVEMGIRYLGLLADRFEGVTPLAIASYNAGPHNVSAWIEGLGPGTELDVFLECVPFVETRAYVRKVLLFYEKYVQLYGDDHDRVVLPPAVAGNFPRFVDF